MDILIVEDDPELRFQLELIFSATEFSTTILASAESALNVVVTVGLPGLLVTDLNLGAGMSGLDLAEALAAQSPDLSVIFISGDQDLISFVEAKSRDRVLRKPFRRLELLAAVREKWRPKEAQLPSAKWPRVA